MAWKPIGGAPRENYQWVLGCVLSRAMDRYRYGPWKIRYVHNEGWLDENGDIRNPTHYQPLPSTEVTMTMPINIFDPEPTAADVKEEGLAFDELLTACNGFQKENKALRDCIRELIRRNNGEDRCADCESLACLSDDKSACLIDAAWAKARELVG